MDGVTCRTAKMGAAMLAALLSSSSFCTYAATITFDFINVAEPQSMTKSFSQSGVQLDVTAQGAVGGPLGNVFVTKNTSGLGVNSSADGVADAGTLDSNPPDVGISVEDRLVFTFTTSAPLVRLLEVDLLSNVGTPWEVNDNLDLYADGMLVLGPDFDPVVSTFGVWNVTGAGDITFTSSFAIALTNNSVEESTRIQSITIQTIPLPAAVWLFGSGLLGLVGIARKRRAAA